MTPASDVSDGTATQWRYWGVVALIVVLAAALAWFALALPTTASTSTSAPYAPYTAGPVVPEQPYAPYTAGPVVPEQPYAPYERFGPRASCRCRIPYFTFTRLVALHFP